MTNTENNINNILKSNILVPYEYSPPQANSSTYSNNRIVFDMTKYKLENVSITMNYYGIQNNYS
jgi:hypothetical protein